MKLFIYSRWLSRCKFHLPTGDAGLILGLGRLLEKKITTHCSILPAWVIPPSEKPEAIAHGAAKSWTQFSDYNRQITSICHLKLTCYSLKHLQGNPKKSKNEILHWPMAYFLWLTHTDAFK